jgi:hypothetical protein
MRIMQLRSLLCSLPWREGMESAERGLDNSRPPCNLVCFCVHCSPEAKENEFDMDAKVGKDPFSSIGNEFMFAVFGCRGAVAMQRCPR